MADDWGNDPIQHSTHHEDDWGNDPIVESKQFKLSQKKLDEAKLNKPKTFWQKVGDVAIAPKIERDPTFMKAVGGGIVGAPSAAASAFGNTMADIPKALNQPLPRYITDAKPGALPVGPTGQVYDPGSSRAVMDFFSSPFSAISGLASSIVGRPVEQATGLRRGITGDVISAAVPLSGPGSWLKGAKAVSEVVGKGGNALRDFVESARMADPELRALSEAAKPASTLAKTVDAPAGADYAAKVAKLRKEGIEPTLGQIKGGQARRAEEAAKSDPLIGGAVRDQEHRAIQSFNKALYNRVLAPIGQKAPEGLQAGRDAVKLIGDKVSKAYEALIPKMKLVPSDEFVGDLAELRTTVGELPPAQQSQFEAILNNRVLHRLGQSGEMDGATFKQVESEVGRLSRNYRGAPDPAQRELGDKLDDLLGIMRSQLEKSSAPEIRAELKKTNESYAMLTRLEDASNARRGAGGVVAPGDLLGAIRKMDRSVRKRSFARGDALLQDFAEDAYDVLGNKMPDSGTPERLNFNHRGLLMYALSKATNPAASGTMNMLKNRMMAETSRPRNYLLSESLRNSPLVRRAPILSLNDLQNISGQSAGKPKGN